MTRKKKHQSTFLKKEERAFWGFISPWLIGFILLTFGPMLYSFYAFLYKLERYQGSGIYRIGKL